MRWWMTFCLAISLALATPGFASESLRIGGGQPQVQLQFRIVIPQILSLQIGSDDLSLAAADLKTAASSGDPRRIPVKAAGAVPGKQPIVLTAITVTPMSTASRTIAMNKASWNRAGDPGPAAFEGGLNQRVDYWRGSGNRTSAYSPGHAGIKERSGSKYHPEEILYTLSSP